MAAFCFLSWFITKSDVSGFSAKAKRMKQALVEMASSKFLSKILAIYLE
jgi:hypothetical protein